MSQLLIDALDNAGQWQAFAADGATPSTQLAVKADARDFRYGADKQSLRVSGSVNALNHRVRRTLNPLDLSNFDELRVWFKSSRSADGSTARPFFLEVRLASATMDLNAPGNTWVRLIPIAQANTWELAQFSLQDLPSAIRSAVNVIQLRCVDASVPFTFHLDDLLAVRHEMIGDVDAALLARLDKQLTLNGTPAPAVIYSPPDKPANTPTPHLRITHFDLRFAEERTLYSQARSDYTATGFRLRPFSAAYDLSYEIAAVADSRAEQTRLLEFVLAAFVPYGTLLVNGIQLPIECVNVASDDLIGGSYNGNVLLHFVVRTYQARSGAGEPATPPFNEVSIALDQPTPA
ncbi:MAG: hypothetical protein HY741_05760 [Chloroflexi bacterium]|nr:hypothetical protein [Chloroflexota bacterium]